jgi:hypothetical protein
MHFISDRLTVLSGFSCSKRDTYQWHVRDSGCSFMAALDYSADCSPR